MDIQDSIEAIIASPLDASFEDILNPGDFEVIIHDFYDSPVSPLCKAVMLHYIMTIDDISFESVEVIKKVTKIGKRLVENGYRELTGRIYDYHVQGIAVTQCHIGEDKNYATILCHLMGHAADIAHQRYNETLSNDWLSRWRYHAYNGAKKAIAAGDLCCASFCLDSFATAMEKSFEETHDLNDAECWAYFKRMSARNLARYAMLSRRREFLFPAAVRFLLSSFAHRRLEKNVTVGWEKEYHTYERYMDAKASALLFEAISRISPASPEEEIAVRKAKRYLGMSSKAAETSAYYMPHLIKGKAAHSLRTKWRKIGSLWHEKAVCYSVTDAKPSEDFICPNND